MSWKRTCHVSHRFRRGGLGSHRFHRGGLCFGLCLVIATQSWAAVGRLRGTVFDADQSPLDGVQVTATSDELPSFRAAVTSDSRGRFLLSFKQIQFSYVLLLEKPGFQSLQTTIRPTGTQIMQETYVLQPAPKTQVIERHGDLASVVTGSTDPAVTAFNSGLDAQRAEDLDAAEAHFREAIAADPDLIPAHVSLAQVLGDSRRYEEAVAATAVALELDPRNLEALKTRYDSLRALGRRDEAGEVAALLASAEDGVATARRVYREGAEAFQAEDLETALAKFEEAANYDPSLVDAHHAIATIRYSLEDYEGSVEAAKHALSLGSEDVRTLRVLYDAYQAAGQIDELVEFAPRLAAVDPDFGGPKLLEQAGALYNAGDTEKAAVILQQVLKIDPSLGKTYYLLGLYHVQKGENDDARTHFQKFLELAPDDPDAGTAREMLGYLE